MFFDFTIIIADPGTLTVNLLIHPDKLGVSFLIAIFLLVITLMTVSIERCG
jgi:hypothetical protein